MILPSERERGVCVCALGNTYPYITYTTHASTHKLIVSPLLYGSGGGVVIVIYSH